MKQTSLSRRLLAGAAGLVIGGGSALAITSPAMAEEETAGLTAGGSFKALAVTGETVCDEAAEEWSVDWTVTNTSLIKLTPTITDVITDEGSVDGVGDIEVGAELAKGDSLSGTQNFSTGIESADLTVELTWTWRTKEWYKDGRSWKWRWVEHSKTKTESASVELGDCHLPPPPPPPNPPEVIVAADCDVLVVFVNNSEGDAAVTMTLAPNPPADHGPVSGFSYTVHDIDDVEIHAEDGAGLDEVVGEADGDNPVVLNFEAGSPLYTHGFEASSDLEVFVTLALDGEELDLGDDATIVWSDITYESDCDGGAGGEDELPVTGSSTLLIAGGALALLALGGGMFMVARRRRVTFTA